MEKQIYLTAENICYHYKKGVFSLNDISLQLFKGDFCALCGKNGSGKTTLLKVLAGIFTPSKGSLVVDGQDALKMTLGQRGCKSGYLFQNPAVQIFAPTVEEELSFIPRLSGWSEAAIVERRAELLTLFQLEHLAEATTFYLSRGEKQRLALAGMLFMHPEYLFLDEPTTGLDKKRKDILADLLFQLLEQGIGMTMISHDRSFLEQFRGMKFVMEGGRLVDEQPL